MDSERFRQIEALYHDALARPPEARAAFLAESCPDHDLRREVESLLGQSVEGQLPTAGAAALAAGVASRPEYPMLAGHRFGAYVIHSLAGRGGMGEVYRARDTRLGRDVAIKILPRTFTADLERLARFEREARALASFNHPNIATIHGVEESDGLKGLVMELVAGETLADRIQRGPVPMTDALPLARQMVDALEAAHDKGIVHRDLKPANINITPNGIVKVLDFGLAKLQARGSDVASVAPTVTVGGTQDGLILGTAAYMSPEQARGQTIDKRTDIWAFGCILYEMVTGRAAFARGTLTDTLVAVVEQQPAWTALPATTPAAIVRLLHWCLEKDSRRRLRDIGDAALELDAASDAAVDSRTQERDHLRRYQTMVVAVIAFAAGAVALWSLNPEPITGPRESVRFAIPVRSDETFPLDSGLPPPMAISRDGRNIVYVARRPTGNRIYLRHENAVEPTVIRGTEGGIGPFISPDGGWVGFAQGGFLKKVPIAGGSPQTLAPVANLTAASWGVEDWIVYAEWSTGLFKVPAGGGAPEVLTTLDKDARETGHMAPHTLPGGSAIIFAVDAAGKPPRLDLVELATGRRRSLMDGQNPQYVSTGHLVFTRGNTLHAVPFDLSRLEVTGSVVRMPEEVRSPGPRRTDFAIAANGTLVYLPAAPSVGRLVWLDKRGNSRQFIDEPARYGHPRISPDGTRVLVQIVTESGIEFWIYDLDRGRRLRLSATGSRPIWTRDGRHITFQRDGNLYSMPADDSKPAELLLARDASANGLFPLAWSRDGSLLVYSRPAPATNRDVFTLSAGGTPRPFLDTPRDERSAMLSPDGRWMVYAALEPGREEEVYVEPYPESGEREVISQGGGREPVWSPTGSEIFYRSIDGRRMMAVEVKTEPTFSRGRPRTIFEGHFLNAPFWAGYDVTPDGNEFLMVEASDETASHLHVVLHWIDAVVGQQQ